MSEPEPFSFTPPAHMYTPSASIGLSSATIVHITKEQAKRQEKKRKREENSIHRERLLKRLESVSNTITEEDVHSYVHALPVEENSDEEEEEVKLPVDILNFVNTPRDEQYVTENIEEYTYPKRVTDVHRISRKNLLTTKKTRKEGGVAPRMGLTLEEFSPEEAHRAINYHLSKIKRLANICSEKEYIEDGGREVMETLRLELERMCARMSEKLGSGDDCFMCLYGNRQYDDTSMDKVNGLYAILTNNAYKDCSMKAISSMQYAYWRTEIYIPSLEMGLCLPHMSAEKFEKHIREHILDPRIQNLLTLEMVTAIKNVMATRLLVLNQTKGQLEFDYKLLAHYHRYVTLETSLRKQDHRTMVGYDESLPINPGKSYIESKITIENSLKD